MQGIGKNKAVSIILAIGLVFLSGCEAREKNLSRAQLVTRAEAYLHAGKYYKALSELKEALAKDPGNATVHVELGWVYLYTNQMDKASAELKLLESLGNPPSVHYLKGAFLAKLGQWVNALEEYNEALNTDPDNPKLHADIAHAFLQINEPEDALREYSIAVKLDPNDDSNLFGQCMGYRQLGHYKEAITACQQAMALSSDAQEKDQIQTVIQNIQLLQSVEPAKSS
jgi:tetratricopeptide (TPR) repeat protein